MSFDRPFFDWLFVGLFGLLFIGAACAVGVIVAVASQVAAVAVQLVAWGLE